MSTSSTLSPNVLLPTPRIRLGGMIDVVSQPLAHGGGSLDVQQMFVSVSDCSDELFTNPELDARIELLRYRSRKTGRRDAAGFVHPSDWTGQANATGGGRTRGGDHYDSSGGTAMSARTSVYNLLGTAEGDEHGAIDLAPWYDTKSVATPSGDFPVYYPTGSNPGSYDGASSIMVSGNVPMYNKWHPSMYLRFRVSIVDIHGDGTTYDRLTGPESATVKVTPSPFPIFPDGNGGVGNKPTSQLVVAFAGGASG